MSDITVSAHSENISEIYFGNLHYEIVLEKVSVGIADADRCLMGHPVNDVMFYNTVIQVLS